MAFIIALKRPERASGSSIANMESLEFTISIKHGVRIGFHKSVTADQVLLDEEREASAGDG